MKGKKSTTNFMISFKNFVESIKNFFALAESNPKPIECNVRANHYTMGDIVYFHAKTKILIQHNAVIKKPTVRSGKLSKIESTKFAPEGSNSCFSKK